MVAGPQAHAYVSLEWRHFCLSHPCTKVLTFTCMPSQLLYPHQLLALARAQDSLDRHCFAANANYQPSSLSLSLDLNRFDASNLHTCMHQPSYEKPTLVSQQQVLSEMRQIDRVGYYRDSIVSQVQQTKSGPLSFQYRLTFLSCSFIIDLFRFTLAVIIFKLPSTLTGLAGLLVWLAR